MLPAQARLHPGLVKIRAAPLVKRRTLQRLTAHLGPFRSIIEAPDVVSEECTHEEGGARWHGGSTSVLLLHASVGGSLPELELDPFTEVLRCDPHVRLCVRRIAHREAAARARGSLSPQRAEIEVRRNPRGIAFQVKVAASLTSSQLRKATAGGADR